MGRWVVALCVLTWWAAQGPSAVAVWRSDLTLWRHVATSASGGTVRAQRNYAKALFVVGERDAAARRFAMVDR